MGKYRFNKDQLKFVEDKRGIRGWIRVLLKYFIASIFLAVAYYVVFAFLVSTEQERTLEREMEIMSQEYARMQEKMVVMDNSIKDLQHRDRDIYRSIFNAEPPVFSVSGGYDMFEGIDTTSMEAIVKDSKIRLSVIEKGIGSVNASIKTINGNLEALGPQVRSLPSIIPIKDFSIRQSGASVGKKVNPFYKNITTHTGMDLLAGTGTEVLAAADGVVEKATRKGKKDGNSIIINHKNGYVTK